MKNYYVVHRRGGSYRRQILDALQEKYSYLYKGIVLDIGGRDRGAFRKPKEKVDKWIFADINQDYNPDIILDVTNMAAIDSNSIDVVNAIELFEHVNNIKVGLKECYRVLRKNGVFIISVPFLFHIHADPYDYQRWTYIKWREELKKIGFKIEHLIIMGKFFTTFAESLKDVVEAFQKSHSNLKSIIRIIFPLINLIPRFDNKDIVKKTRVLDNYHGGYFIISRK